MTSEWAEQPASADKHGVPGKALAAQREAMGWSVEQVADQLKMAVRQVVALEAGDYASLPGPAVVRGFVRAYAKVVKLDAAPLVAMIALDTPAPDTTPTTVRRDKPASFSEVRFPTNGKKRSRLPLLPLLGVAVLAALAFGAWRSGLVTRLTHGGNASSASSAVLPPALPAAGNGAASVTVLPSPVSGQGADTGTGAGKPGEAQRPLITPSVPLISVPPPSAASGPGAAALPPAAPAPAAGAPAAAGNALVLTVKEDSWVEVRPAKGKPLLSKLAHAGSTETVEVTGPVTLIVGKPSAVDATLRGKALPLPAVAGGRVARVAVQ